MADSLGKVAAKYTGLRLGIMLIAFGLSCAVVLPLAGTAADDYFKAAVIALVITLPLSYWLGKDLRERMSVLLTQQRDASRARVEDTQARYRAVQDAKGAADADEPAE
jgi:hypothetical protein